MKGKIAQLEAQVKSLSDGNNGKEAKLAKLSGSTKLLKRAYDDLEREDATTRAKMEAMRGEFRLSEELNDYLYGSNPLVLTLLVLTSESFSSSFQLKQIQALLGKISDEYFTNLPIYLR